MDISAHGLAFIESFEGYRYNAYWDPWGKVWTVGYGETERITSTSTMTRAQAERDLDGRVIREYEPSIKNLGVPLNQNQFDALCSFVWNLGPGSMQWDIGRDLRAREYKAAADCMLEYVHAGGEVLAGLVRRRQEERTLFLTPVGPDPYALFDNTLLSFSRKWIAAQPQLGKKHPELLRTFSGDTLRLRERDTVRERDRLSHITVNSSDFHRHQLWILVLRLRLAYIANHEHNGWQKYHRRHRWNQMWYRTRNVT